MLKCFSFSLSSWFIARLVIGRTPLQHKNPTAIGHQVEVKGLVLTLRGATFRARLCFANLPRRVLPHDCLKYHLYVPSVKYHLYVPSGRLRETGVPGRLRELFRKERFRKRGHFFFLFHSLQEGLAAFVEILSYIAHL